MSAGKTQIRSTAALGWLRSSYLSLSLRLRLRLCLRLTFCLKISVVEQFQGDVPNCTDLVLKISIEFDGKFGP